MEPNKPSSGRKVRFAPKAPPQRKKKKPDETMTGVGGDDGDDDAEDKQALLKRVNDNLVRRGPKVEVETKSSVQVVFGHGAASSTFVPREGSHGQSSSLRLKYSASSDEETAITNDDSSDDKEYAEPWDYENSYYPTTLPLRRPNSGNPELLDEAEFGDAETDFEYVEEKSIPASELGLEKKNDEPQMFFLQLPPILPSVKRSIGGKDSANVKGKEKVGSSEGKKVIGSSVTSGSKESCSLEDLPGGYMGKMYVYNSGKVKLKLGSILYDVTPGVECEFSQHFAAMNTVEKHCCVLGDVRKRAVVTPDVDLLMNPAIDLG